MYDNIGVLLEELEVYDHSLLLYSLVHFSFLLSCTYVGSPIGSV